VTEIHRRSDSAPKPLVFGGSENPLSKPSVRSRFDWASQVSESNRFHQVEFGGGV